MAPRWPPIEATQVGVRLRIAALDSVFGSQKLDALALHLGPNP
jgi:hypothetical protein